MNHTAALVSLATSIPPYQFHQKQILQAAHDLLADRYPQFETLSSLFANTGIRHRYGVKPIEWYLERRGWPERTQAFLEGAESLFVDVARKALARADLSAGDIDTVVTVCSTGIATPTLEARVAGKLGFRTDVSRVPVFGLGCAGGVSGLSIASRLAQARPGTNVLLVALELCTLAVRHDELTKANIVAASLFGDGAAAIILRAGDGGATRIEATGEKLWPDTLDIMGWSVDPEGFGVIFQRTIPDFVAEHVGPAVDEMLARMKLSAGRCRSLHLPSRRHQGDRRARARAVARSGHARSRARGHRRLRQHVGADRAVRARTRHCAGPAGALAADRARARASPQAASRCGTPRELRVDHPPAGHAAATGRARSRPATTPRGCWRAARSRSAPAIIRWSCRFMPRG